MGGLGFFSLGFFSFCFFCLGCSGAWAVGAGRSGKVVDSGSFGVSHHRGEHGEQPYLGLHLGRVSCYLREAFGGMTKTLRGVWRGQSWAENEFACDKIMALPECLVLKRIRLVHLVVQYPGIVEEEKLR